MFNRKTLFVVGAGGSKELGLPIGDELKDHIAAKLNIKFNDGYNRRSGDVHVYRAVKVLTQERGERDGESLLVCRQVYRRSHAAGALYRQLS